MKQHLNNFKNTLSTTSKNLFDTTKNAMNNAKTTLTKPIDTLQYIKNKNKQIKDLITQSNQTIQSEIISINLKLETFEERKLLSTSSTIEEYISLMKRIEHLPFPILNIEKQKECFSFKYDDFKEKYSVIHKKTEVDARYSEMLIYSQNIENTKVKFQQLESFMNNIINLLDKYNVSCIKLNKQTINIISKIGTNYDKYTKEQKSIIQKHNFYIDTISHIYKQKLINNDGRLNDRIVSIIHDANEYLNTHKDIVFKDFQKKKNPLKYILPIILLLSLLTFIFYF